MFWAIFFTKCLRRILQAMGTFYSFGLLELKRFDLISELRLIGARATYEPYES